jgi:rare lipoprotein A
LIKHIVVVAALVTGSMSFVTGETLAAGNQCGTASWYGPGFHGRKAASGETYNQNAMTAAHKTLPFGTKLKVTNEKTGKSVTVKINDRGPYHGGRVIDLSKAAASQLGIVKAGTGKVCFTRV